MRKIFAIFLVLTLTMSLFGCNGGTLYDISYPKPVVVEPDEATRYTINGYKDITVSSESTTSNLLSENDNTQTVEERYIGNTNSQKLHRIGCSYTKNLKDENITIFTSLDDAISGGYTKCSRCFK